MDRLTIVPKEPLVKVTDLTMRYGEKVALKGLNLELFPGRIIGLLGPNGSGKTTLIKILAGLITAYSGRVNVLQQRPNEKTKAEVAYLPDRNYFAAYRTPNYGLKVFEDFYRDFDQEKCKAMMQCMAVDATQEFSQMSKGMVDKFLICLTMSRRAKLYLLDEPIGFVDPSARDLVLDTILENYHEQGTILIATHLISELERIFDTVIFLKEGEIQRIETVDALRTQSKMSVTQLFKEVFPC